MGFRVILVFFLLLISGPAIHAQTNGFVTLTDEKGNVSKGNMKNGVKEGEWTTTTSQGYTISLYEHGQLTGTETVYFKNGKVAEVHTYVNGKRNGISAKFAMNGDTMQVERFRNDTLQGFSYRYLPSANFLYEYGYYTNGKKEGLWVERTKAGDYEYLDSSMYANDSLHGLKRVYQNGQLKLESEYSHGRRDGREIMYHYPEGGIAWVKWSKRGLADSISQHYDKDGNKIRESTFGDRGKFKTDSSWVVSGNKKVLSEAAVYNSAGVETYRETIADGITEKTYFGDDGLVDSLIKYEGKGRMINRRMHVQSDLNKYTRVKHYNDWRYDDKGRLSSYGLVYGGLKEGLWTWVDSTGKIKKEINHSRGTPQGRYTTYYPNHKVKVQGVCVNGYLRDSIRVFSSTGTEFLNGTEEYKRVLDQNLAEESDVYYAVLGAVTLEGDDVTPAVEPDQPEVFTFAEEMPRFPGDSLDAYLQHNIVYPSLEREQGKAGTVYVRFVVETDGSITNVRVVKQVPGAPGLSVEAIRVISNMPKWSPAKMNGRPIRLEVTQAVRFKID